MAKNHASYLLNGVYSFRLNVIFCLLFVATFASHSQAQSASSWADVPLDRRCEGLLEFLKNTGKLEIPEWTPTKPECVIAGSLDTEISWSLDAHWQKGAKALPLRYVISQKRKQIPKTFLCVVKGKESGCAAPWDSSFSIGTLYPSKDAARSAYEGVVKLSKGFIAMSLKLDEWMQKKDGKVKIFDLTYLDWIRAWTESSRSLPVGKEIFVAEYSPARDDPMAGQVKIKGNLPQELRECLGCGKTTCDRTAINYEFSELTLVISRNLSPEEEKVYHMKTAEVGWLMTDPTPFIAGDAKWPFLCGQHRFNLKKF